MMNMGLRSRLGSLALLLSCCQAGSANPFSQQLYLVGESYPYEYSRGDFRRATSTPTLLNSVSITGYDITARAGDNSTTADFMVEGWRLAVSVATDVPIPRPNPDSEGGSKVFDTALLSLSPPSRLVETLEGNAPPQEWSVCSAIWTQGLSQAALAAASVAGSDASGSSCDGILSSECIAEMEAGFNTAGFCQNQTLPRSCSSLLANGTDGVTRASNLPQTIGDLTGDSAFFAAATPPLDKGNASAFEAASTWIFPVVLSWRYRGPSGSAPRGDTRSHVACVRAAASTLASSGADNGSGSSDGIGNGAGRLSPVNGWWEGLALLSALVAGAVVL
ncbi:hypothetical protein OQA88_11251 [Cercophora sp. LCS_1]